MNVLLVAATPFEIAPVLKFLETYFPADTAGAFEKSGLVVTPLITGVGSVATTWQLARYFSLNPPPDLAINAGIAGAFDRSLALGMVVQVTRECFGDLGVEEADGAFTDLFSLGLSEANRFPYSGGWLRQPDTHHASFLPPVAGLTVNKVHGHLPSIESIRRAFPEAQVESMEGAAFFYACLVAGIPFMEIRSISNYVEPRNRDAWQLAPAIQNLNEVLIQILQALGEAVAITPPVP